MVISILALIEAMLILSIGDHIPVRRGRAGRKQQL